MTTMTPPQAADRLRIVADLLALTAGTPVPLQMFLHLDVSKYSTSLDEPGRVAAVTAVADALGLTAEAVKQTWWQFEAIERGTGFVVRVYTDITGPQMCVCGATCTHTGALAAAA